MFFDSKVCIQECFGFWGFFNGKNYILMIVSDESIFIKTAMTVCAGAGYSWHMVS